MTRSIILRTAARRDLAQLAETSIRRWGGDRTADYLADIQRTIQRAASEPEIGSDRHHVAPGLRKLNSGSHAVYFFFDRRTLRVARILHVRQDVGAKIVNQPKDDQ